MNVRNNHIDNIKGILILCVVVGHAIEPTIGRSDLSAWLYWFVYIFHMPLFAAVSGYLSASQHGEKEDIGILSGLVVPYIVFELAYTTLDAVLTGSSWELSVFKPYWLLWYFFALIVWRMILPIWLQLRWPLATAVVVGLLAGVTNHIGYYFSLSRILVFLPFFVAGALARQGKLCLPSIPYSKFIAISILMAAGVFAWYGSEQASVRWLYGSYHYGHFDKEWIDGIAIRFGIYLVSAASCLSVVVLAPKRWTIWAWVGIYSLYPYVLHGMVVRFAESKHVYRLVEGDLQVMILVSLAVGATFLLALRPARACVDGVLAVFRGVLIKGPKGTVGQPRGGRSGSAVVQSQG